MKTSLKTILCVTLALCLPALAAAPASAEYYVPPENSAVNQYTQTIPSAGGDKSGESKEVSAAEALGEKNAKRLQKQGPEGDAAAELAAETAPAPVEESAPTPSANSESPKKGKKHGAKHKGGKGKQKQHEGGATGTTGGGKPSAPSGNSAAGETAKGGSAVGELASQATGLSGGTLGIFLPLVILAAIVWAGAYLWRRQGSADSGPLPR